MDYEIVDLPEKFIVGITQEISNQSPPMSLWGRFYSSVLSKIVGQMNTKAYGVYFDFNENGCVSMVACEVRPESNQSEFITEYTIPAGKYAKFCIKGEVHQIVPEFWSKINDLDLQRSYQCDFEIFPSSEIDDVDIEIYISIV